MLGFSPVFQVQCNTQGSSPASSSEPSRKLHWRRDDIWCRLHPHLQSPGDNQHRTGATVGEYECKHSFKKNIKFNTLFITKAGVSTLNSNLGKQRSCRGAQVVGDEQLSVGVDSCWMELPQRLRESQNQYFAGMVQNLQNLKIADCYIINMFWERLAYHSCKKFKQQSPKTPPIARLCDPGHSANFCQQTSSWAEFSITDVPWRCVSCHRFIFTCNEFISITWVVWDEFKRLYSWVNVAQPIEWPIS